MAKSNKKLQKIYDEVQEILDEEDVPISIISKDKLKVYYEDYTENSNFQNRVKGIMAQVIVLKLWNMVNPNILLQAGKKEDYLRNGKKGEFKAIFSTYPYKNGISDKTISDVSKITPQMLSNYQSMVDEYSYVYMSDMDKGNVIIYTISTDDLKKTIKENFNYIIINFLDGEVDLFGNKKIMMHIPPHIIDQKATKTIIYRSLIF